MALEAALQALGADSGASLAGSMRVSQAEQAGRDQVRLRILQTEAADPANANDAALRKELAREQAKQGQPANEPLSGALAALTEAGTKKPLSLVEQIPGNEPRETLKPAEISTYDRLVKGPIQAGAAVATGLVAAPVGAIAGLWKGLTSGKYGTPEGAREAEQHAQDVINSLTYTPRAEAGKEALQTVADVFGATKLQGMGPTEAITLGGVAAQPLAGKWIDQYTKVAPAKVAGQMASVGAAGTDPIQMALAKVQNASPELHAQVTDAFKRLRPGQTINQEVLDRVIAADSVGVKLMPGQMTRDPEIFTREMNNRLARPAIMNRLKEQNAQLIAKTNDIREAAAPDVYVSSRPEVGKIPIDAYKAKDAAANAEISTAYKALENANGGNFPLDVKGFVAAADKDLHKALLYDHVPGAIRKTMDSLLKNNNMTFENFESLRTNLARIMRSATADGNEKAAAGVIRDALEKMPMTPEAEAAGLKPLADTARSLAKQRFDLIKADPAYKAVVTGKAVPDDFIQKFVVNAPVDVVETVRNNLAHDPVAQQALSAGLIDHLKQVAKIKSTPEGDIGNFAQDSFNTALGKQRPKIGILFDAEQNRLLENLGHTARLVKEQPAGAAVNNSNTAVTLMGEAAKSSAEGLANVAAHGVPIGTWTRKVAGTIREARAVKGTMNPSGAILLKDVGK